MSSKLFENLIWLNSADLAEYLRSSEGSVRQMVYKGIIKPYKIGRKNLFKRSEIDNLLESSIKKEIRHGN